MTNWILVKDEEPPVNTFCPLWWWDGMGIGMGHYQGNGAWETGLVHAKITHWARIEVPEPPYATHNKV